MQSVKKKEALFEAETPLEARILADTTWQHGIEQGKVRRGHPEGKIKYHIVEVLANLEKMRLPQGMRHDLRLVTFIHDSFKHKVKLARPRNGENHHAMIARRFAETVLDEREDLLDLIELHDEAYNAWRMGQQKNLWDKAQERSKNLLDRVGDNIGLYILFYIADTCTGDKEPDGVYWFLDFCAREGALDADGRANLTMLIRDLHSNS